MSTLNLRVTDSAGDNIVELSQSETVTRFSSFSGMQVYLPTTSEETRGFVDGANLVIVSSKTTTVFVDFLSCEDSPEPPTIHFADGFMIDGWSKFADIICNVDSEGVLSPSLLGIQEPEVFLYTDIKDGGSNFFKEIENGRFATPAGQRESVVEDTPPMVTAEVLTLPEDIETTFLDQAGLVTVAGTNPLQLETRSTMSSVAGIESLVDILSESEEAYLHQLFVAGNG